MTDYPYQPPERMFADTLLAFNDFEMASTWKARVEPDPHGPVNKIVRLMRGQRRVRSVLWPVSPGATVRLVRDDGAWTLSNLYALRNRLWDSRGTDEPPPRIDIRPPGWRIEVDDMTVLTVTDTELAPPYVPPPSPPWWTRARTALHARLRTETDRIAARLGYRPADEWSDEW